MADPNTSRYPISLLKTCDIETESMSGRKSVNGFRTLESIYDTIVSSPLRKSSPSAPTGMC